MAQKLRRIAKPLRSLAVLSERSALPSLTARALPSSSSKPKTKVTAAEKDRLRRIARKALPADGEQLRSADIKASSSALSDAWAATPEIKAQGGFGQEGMTKRLPKAPVTLAKRREVYLSAQVEARGAVETPEGGTSYNPSAESHSKLIDSAYEEEKALLAREEEEAKRVKGGEEILAARRVRVEGEYAPGMTVGPGELDGEGKVDEDESEESAMKKKASKRKTQAQRNKALRLKEAARLEKMEAQKKKLLRSVGNAKTLQKSLEGQQKAMAEAEKLAKFVKREKERMGLKGGEKIGKHRLAKGKVAVQLGEDLAESLRQIKVGSPLLMQLEDKSSCCRSPKATSSRTGSWHCKSGHSSNLGYRSCPRRRSGRSKSTKSTPTSVSHKPATWRRFIAWSCMHGLVSICSLSGQDICHPLTAGVLYLAMLRRICRGKSRVKSKTSVPG